MECEAFVPPELLRRSHLYPQFISVPHFVWRLHRNVVHDEFRVLASTRVNVGQRGRHRDALAVAAQVEMECKV
jgi:hypothetical protein